MYGHYRVLLSAAAIMLGLGLVGLLRGKLSKSSNKFRWGLIGVCGLVCMVVMSWHIFFGIRVSPFSGVWYTHPDKGDEIRRGYVQKYDQISRRLKNRGKDPWEQAGEYIRLNSAPTDKMYVWGWVPGIYVSAQRFSAASRLAMIPHHPPAVLAKMVDEMLAEFEKEKPKFIVDSRKRHVPMERPPHELWPIARKGFAGMNRTWFLPLEKNVIEAYDRSWSQFLKERFDEAEAERYRALAPLREFVMNNYVIVAPRQYVATQDGRLFHRMFGKRVLFRLKNPTPKEQMQ
jgi:hypothetical protein